MQLPIHSYAHRSSSASSARLVNCFAEALPPDAKTPVLLTRTPGIATWTTVGNGPIRGMLAQKIELNGTSYDYLYVVSGSKLYYVDSAKSVTEVGDIGTPNRIDIAAGRATLVVVNEPRGYYWDGTTFAEITDNDFVSRGAGDVEFLGGFMIFREPNSWRFFLSGKDTVSSVEDVTSYDALQFANVDAHPDNLVGMIAQHRQLVNFCSESGEIWENVGSSGVPFERNINGSFEEGCLNADTIVSLDNSIYWVADDYTVRRLEGITPQRVSTHAIEQKLTAATESTFRAFTYDQEGHFFYVLSADEGTWVLDVSTGEWAERQTYGRSTWNPQYHAQFAGKELVGDSTSNKIGYFDPETYTDWGSTQRMEWTYQTVYAEGQRAFHDRFEVVLDTGVGTTTGQGSDPKIMLQKSDDGGKTWQSMPDKPIGPLGERFARAVWHNLGSARQRVYRCAISDPVAVTVTDTLLNARGGRL